MEAAPELSVRWEPVETDGALTLRCVAFARCVVCDVAHDVLGIDGIVEPSDDLAREIEGDVLDAAVEALRRLLN